MPKIAATPATAGGAASPTTAAAGAPGVTAGDLTTSDLTTSDLTTSDLATGSPAVAADAQRPESAGDPGVSWRRPGALLRRHWLAALLLAGGLALRILTQISFSPALLYIDSVKYLYHAWPEADPQGYDVPLKLILLVGNLSLVEAVQHLLGLGMAVTLYLILLRRGVPRWLAALAMGPVLLDAYQLQMEATIMPDVWFEAAIVAGLAVLLWPRRPSMGICILAGFVLGLSATVRQVGEILVVPAVIFVLASGGGWRKVVGKAIALGLAFAVPIVVYCSGALYLTGHFWLSRNSTQSTYGRMAGAADCATLVLPSYERALCPTPAQQALGADWLDHDASSPLRQFRVPHGMPRAAAITNFNKRVVVQQPLRVASRAVSDAAKLFAVVRQTSPGDTPISRWQFHTSYPTFTPTIYTNRQGTIIFGLKLAVSGGPTIYRKLDTSYGGNAHVWVPGAAFLRRYQLYGGYTPGPLLLLTLIAGVAGALTVFRRRASFAQRQLALGSLLLIITAVGLLGMSDLFEFTWRYQLPALVTLPPAGAIGIAAATRFVRRRRSGSVS
jgi:hypothetical protein